MNFRVFLPALLIVAGCANDHSSIKKVSQPANTSPAPQLVFLGGDFWKPGAYPWTNGMTLRQAINAAGGLNDFALPSLMITHRNGQRERLKLNESRQLTNNPVVLPGDRIENPRR